MSGVTVLSGGVGAARFLHGLFAAVDPETISTVVNTGDDTVLHGLARFRVWHWIRGNFPLDRRHGLTFRH